MPVVSDHRSLTNLNVAAILPQHSDMALKFGLLTNKALNKG